MPQQYSAYWAQLEKERGLPPGYLGTTRQIESAGNRFAVSPTGPVGPFQFTQKTAKAYGLPLDQRTDEIASARAAADYAKDNMSFLSKALGRAPAGPELYMAHQQGAGGAASLLKNMNTPAGQLTDPNNISVNAGDPNAPASSIIQKFTDRYNKFSGPGANVGQGPTVANAAALPAPAAAAPAVNPNALPPSPFGAGKGLVGMMQSEGGMTGDKLKTFLGGNEMGAATKGASMLASALAPAPAPAAPPPLPVPEENRPDMSLLAMLKPKRKRGLV